MCVYVTVFLAHKRHESIHGVSGSQQDTNGAREPGRCGERPVSSKRTGDTSGNHTEKAGSWARGSRAVPSPEAEGTRGGCGVENTASGLGRGQPEAAWRVSPGPLSPLPRPTCVWVPGGGSRQEAGGSLQVVHASRLQRPRAGRGRGASGSLPSTCAVLPLLHFLKI